MNEETPKDNPKRNSRWDSFNEATKDEPVRRLLIEAVTEHKPHPGRALDLGPGALNESKYLIDQGFESVVAVNREPIVAGSVVEARAAALPTERFKYHVSSFDTFHFEPNTYDLINAQYSLPFNSSTTFDPMFASLVASLKPGGIVTGQFFGPNDEWNDGSGKMTFTSREHAEQLLAGLEILKLAEIEKPRDLAGGGEQRGHTIHFIARRRQS